MKQDNSWDTPDWLGQHSYQISSIRTQARFMMLKTVDSKLVKTRKTK